MTDRPLGVPDRQEMFSRAVIGLRSQGFRQCMGPGRQCQYSRGDMHCAWGWVEPGLANIEGGIMHLRNNGYGLAAELPIEDVDFAIELQNIHDDGVVPEKMAAVLRSFGNRYGLTWPDATSTENGEGT